VLEHCFCPRFTYFEHVLAIPERQEKRFKVQKGREIHKRLTAVNKSYLRKKIGCVKRERNVYLSTDKGLIGVVDEVLALDDGTFAPLDYKFAEYQGTVFKTYKIQAAFYAHLIRRHYPGDVSRAFLVYTRSRNKLIEVALGPAEDALLRRIVVEIVRILSCGSLPSKGASTNACRDCCYKNICDRGLE